MARHLLTDQNQFRASAPPSWALNLREISLLHCYCFIIYTITTICLNICFSDTDTLKEFRSGHCLPIV